MADNVTIFDPFYVDVYDWTKHAVSIYVSLSFLLGIPGNCLVVLVHIRIKEKSVTDWMVFYVAFCDIMSLVNAPLYVCQLEGYWTLGFPDLLCKYHYFNLNSVSMASYFFCACMALERYYKVVVSKNIFSMTIARFIWIPIFTLSFGMGVIVIFAVANNQNGHCMFTLSGLKLVTIEYFALLIVAVTTTLIMSFCYIRTGLYLLKKMKEINQSGSRSGFSKSYRNTIQTTKMLATVTIVFLLSANTPYITSVFVTINPPTQEPAMSVMLVFALTFFINNFFNPFLYMGMSASFRKRTRALFNLCCPSKYAPSDETTISESRAQ